MLSSPNDPRALTACPTLIAVFVSLLSLCGPARAEVDVAADSLHLAMRDSFLPTVPLLVRVELSRGGAVRRDVWDLDVTIAVEGSDALTPENPTVLLRNGVGSTLIRVEASVPITVTARAGKLVVRKTLTPLDTSEVTTASDPLPAGETEWSGIVHVPDDLLVPPNSVLRILPGTLVLLGSVSSGSGGADIDVEGRLEALGSAESPITLTAAGDENPLRPEAGRAWGEIHHAEAEDSIYEHTFITLAGNSPGGGHTGTGPALRPRDSKITFRSCSITDTEGKTMEAEGSDIEMTDCLLARSVMGPEVDGTQMILERSYIFEMFGDDDNDGIYLHDQRAGQIIRLTDCVVAAGDDDAIDTLGSDVTIEGCIVRDFADKGISVFHDTVLVRRCLIADNDIGVSCKTGNNQDAVVTIEHTTIARNRIGLEARNKGGDEPDARIHYRVRNSIVRRPEEATDDTHTVRTDYDPSFLSLEYTNLSEIPDAWKIASDEGSIYADPLFVDSDARDFRLQPGSPCIDAGDPSSPVDDDGTRADMGAFPYLEPRSTVFDRGDTNADGGKDVADAVTVLLFLFGGVESLPCKDAADIDDSGDLDITDPVTLLGYLFQGGTAPPSPRGDCGTDPTEDALDCEQGCRR